MSLSLPIKASSLVIRRRSHLLQAAKLKNQFRSLDDADIEHLTSVEESVRARERAVKEETTEQLAAFRKHQDELERLALLSTSENAGLAAANVTVEAEDWTAVGRKRKGGKEKEGFRGLKRKKISSSGDKPESADPEKEKELEAAVKSEDLPKKEAKDQVVSSKTGSTGKKAAPSGLGLLAGYSSDSDN